MKRPHKIEQIDAHEAEFIVKVLSWQDSANTTIAAARMDILARSNQLEDGDEAMIHAKAEWLLERVNRR